jgi:hypothetical protein
MKRTGIQNTAITINVMTCKIIMMMNPDPRGSEVAKKFFSSDHFLKLK